MEWVFDRWRQNDAPNWKIGPTKRCTTSSSGVAKGKKRALLPTSQQSLSFFSPLEKGVFLLFGDRFENKLIFLPLLKEGHSWRHFLFWIHWSKLEVRADSKKLSRISNIKNLAQCSTSGYKVDCPQTFLWSVVWSFPVRGRHSDIYSYVISLVCSVCFDVPVRAENSF